MSPNDEPAPDDAQRVVEELRQMAAWLTRPDVRAALPPVSRYASARFYVHVNADDDAAGIAAVEQFAMDLGLPVERSGGQHVAGRAFGHSLVQVVYIEQDHRGYPE